MANYKFPSGSTVAITVKINVSDASYSEVLYTWYKRPSGVDDADQTTEYQKTSASNISTITVTESGDYFVIVTHPRAGSLVSNIAEVEFQPANAWIYCTTRGTNDTRNNSVTSKHQLGEFADGLLFGPSVERSITSPGGASSQVLSGTPWAGNNYYNGEGEITVIPTESDINVECEISGADGAPNGGIANPGKGGYGKVLFTMKKNQEYTFKLGGVTWNSIGVSNGIGWQSANAGLGGGQSIIYRGPRYYIIGAGGGAAGRTVGWDGGDGGGPGINGGNGLGPNGGQGATQSGAGASRGDAYWDCMVACTRNQCDANFQNGLAGRANAGKASGNNGGGGAGKCGGGAGYGNGSAGGGGSGYVDPNVVVVDAQQGGNPNYNVSRGYNQGFVKLKVYTGDLLDNITYADPTIISRPGNYTYTSSNDRNNTRGSGASRSGGRGGAGGGRSTYTIGGSARALAEQVAHNAGYSSYTAYHNAVSHPTYDSGYLRGQLNRR